MPPISKRLETPDVVLELVPKLQTKLLVESQVILEAQVLPW